MITNKEFLEALFKEDAPWTHVTDFAYDPDHIPSDRHLAAWRGDYACRYHMGEITNQYFTISNFYCDEQGQARRRKALYRHTRVIVLDDVREKLNLTEVHKLPPPTWILVTSPGSEQWGYLLTEPATNRQQVENLLDGLISNGLAPNGKDPGMKGVTRYVRLPDGYNTKVKKMINGQPYKCELKHWNPYCTTTLEKLAAPFSVNINAPRREQRTDGATTVEDHPLLQLPDLIHIKDVRSDGRFDITCPWVNIHTGAVDSGTAIFTNADGSMGFKCHHGSCQDRTGRDLLAHLEKVKPGFMSDYSNWQANRMFKDLVQPAPPPVDFFTLPPADAAPAVVIPERSVLQAALGKLMTLIPGTVEIREASASLLKLVDSMPTMERQMYHDDIRDRNKWTKPEFKDILRDLRTRWYTSEKKHDFYDSCLYVKEQNIFYDFKSRIFFSAEAFQNSFSHEDAEARKVALQDGRVRKVERLDYAPKKPRVFNEKGVTMGNTWSDSNDVMGVEGDVSFWLDHWNVLGWREHRDHMLKWMAHTIIYPEHKINHMLILGSGEGCGKDFLLTPLIKAMGHNYTPISGDELLGGFNDFILNTKLLLINEADTGNRQEALSISNSLKPYAAAPPEELRVNQKGIKPIRVRNVINAVMTTNSSLPVRLNGPSRRFYAMWSTMNPRDDRDNMKPHWLAYWEQRWNWMRNGGAEACIWYLRNKVDLSDFNPFAAPQMTEFLRDITESSKSPMQSTIENFIEMRYGVFASDLVTREEASACLRAGDMFYKDAMCCDAKLFTQVMVSRVLSEMPKLINLRARKSATERPRYWVLRDREKYEAMNDTQLYDEYVKQRRDIKPRIEAVR
jgi:hypothetical protein